MELRDCAEPLALDIAFWLGALDDEDYPIAQLGGLTLELGEKLGAVGIILLLTNADSDGFYFNLIRSGRLWLKYLQRVRAAEAYDDHHYASGRYAPLLNAIAVKDLDLADSIASLTPSEWRRGAEYEDDYCYAQLLQRLSNPDVGQDDIVGFLDRFETYLDGEVDPRLDVCRALAESNQEDFDEGFDALLDARELQIADDKERGQLEEPQVVAIRHVFVEGLAILRLAEARGLATEPEYRLCPSLARVPMSRPFPDE